VEANRVSSLFTFLCEDDDKKFPNRVQLDDVVNEARRENIFQGAKWVGDYLITKNGNGDLVLITSPTSQEKILISSLTMVRKHWLLQTIP